MSGRNITIGLLWHSLMSGNHGVNALTVGNIAIVRSAAASMGLEPRFVIFSPGKGQAHRIDEDVEVRFLNRRTLITSGDYWRSVGGLDCMLDISAGDSFADIYGGKRFLWMWLTKRLAIMRGVPLLLAPQTIGPFTRQPWTAMAAGIMRDAELTVARDPLSFSAVADMAPNAPRLLSADVAFRLPFRRREPASDGRIHVGVNVSGLLWRQSGAAGDNVYRMGYDYAALMRALLDALEARDDVALHLVTHVVEPQRALDNDGDVADELAARYPRAIRVPDFASPEDAKSYISGLDLLIAARMHACIAAFSSGVPVVPVSYSRKFTGLFGELLGYPHTLPAQGVTHDAALEFLLSRVDRLPELSAEIAAGNARVAPLLDAYVNALKALFDKIRNAPRHG